MWNTQFFVPFCGEKAGCPAHFWISELHPLILRPTHNSSSRKSYEFDCRCFLGRGLPALFDIVCYIRSIGLAKVSQKCACEYYRQLLIDDKSIGGRERLFWGKARSRNFERNLLPELTGKISSGTEPIAFQVRTSKNVTLFSRLIEKQHNISCQRHYQANINFLEVFQPAYDQLENAGVFFDIFRSKCHFLIQCTYPESFVLATSPLVGLTWQATTVGSLWTAPLLDSYVLFLVSAPFTFSRMKLPISGTLPGAKDAKRQVQNCNLWRWLADVNMVL